MFEDLLIKLHNTEPQPNPNYYHILLENADVVLLEIAKVGQDNVSKRLGMPYPKLSQLKDLLKEYA